MTKIASRPLPKCALMAKHYERGDYLDCLTVDIPQSMDIAVFIQAFYSSPAFWSERKAIGLLLNKATSHDDLAALAQGKSQKFAAWSVEGRSDDQLLLQDYQGYTRSWLMVEESDVGGTRLYFGTSVKAARRTGFVGLIESRTFRLLLPIHKLYARALLRSAAHNITKHL